MDSLWTEFVKSGAVSDYLRYRARCGTDKADGFNMIGINCGQTAQTGKNGQA